MPEPSTLIYDEEGRIRLDYLNFDDGDTYVLGCSSEEAKVLSDNIELVNDEVEGLKEAEKAVAASLVDLNSRIVSLSNDVDTLSDSHEQMADSLSSINDRVDDLEDEVDSISSNEKVISASLNDLNSRITSLIDENTSLRNEITELKQEIALIKRNYMAYYEENESVGIGEDNVYTK